MPQLLAREIGSQFIELVTSNETIEGGAHIQTRLGNFWLGGNLTILFQNSRDQWTACNHHNPAVVGLSCATREAARDSFLENHYLQHCVAENRTMTDNQSSTLVAVQQVMHTAEEPSSPDLSLENVL